MITTDDIQTLRQSIADQEEALESMLQAYAIQSCPYKAGHYIEFPIKRTDSAKGCEKETYRVFAVMVPESFSGNFEEYSSDGHWKMKLSRLWPNGKSKPSSDGRTVTCRQFWNHYVIAEDVPTPTPIPKDKVLVGKS